MTENRGWMSTDGEYRGLGARDDVAGEAKRWEPRDGGQES